LSQRKSKKQSMIFKKNKATISINLQPISSPWGGGNQWVDTFSKYLRKNNYEVIHHLNKKNIDCIFIVDPRKTDNIKYGVNDIKNYIQKNSKTACIHRVNENDKRKNTAFMDKLLEETNQVADYTVFISTWLRDYHTSLWFDSKKPNEVILNSANSQYFHPFKGAPHQSGTPFIFVTHHWSDNWLKGFKYYQLLDEAICNHKVSNLELHIIGRWPNEIKWKSAKTYPATNGNHLAHLLKKGHGYITASQWEPGGMHFLEGAACGLPLLYHENGGGIIEVGKQMGIEFNDSNFLEKIYEFTQNYMSLKFKTLSNYKTSNEMCSLYEKAAQKSILIKRGYL